MEDEEVEDDDEEEVKKQDEKENEEEEEVEHESQEGIRRPKRKFMNAEENETQRGKMDKQAVSLRTLCRVFPFLSLT